MNLVTAFHLSYGPPLQNPNGTLPTLTHGGSSFTSTIAVIDYIVTISSKKVAAATSITTEVHEDKIDPNFALAASVRSYRPLLP